MNTEQYIMEQKALLFKDKTCATKIMESESTPEIKDLGKKVQGFNRQEWENKAPNILEKGLRAKFQQNPKLKKFLIATTDTTLVEASRFDTYWGIGRHLYERDIFKNKEAWGKTC